MMHIRLLSIALAISVSAPALAAPPQPIEPIEIPPSIQQGVDLIYIDPEIAPAVRERDALLQELALKEDAGAPLDLFLPVSPLYTELRRGLVRYQMKFGALPEVVIPAGPPLKAGSTGERVALLRKRLGLAAGTKYDAELAKAVRLYQSVHALPSDGVVGGGTIESLNLGAAHYERLLMINLERARRLPRSTEKERYILVDVGSAQMYLFEDGKMQDRMKVVVGKPETATPMMAALIRYASVNPYWNVPPELVQNLIAPKVIAGGKTYLTDRGYDVLSDWTDEASIVDPETIDWPSVAAGKTEIRVRQRPGGGNSMGDIKFMMPNDYGIYLHDTPNKALFSAEDRWVSNGCVRVEDATRLATWLFGKMPTGADPKVEEKVDLDKPVPVYITYMTAAASGDSVLFRKDPYKRDAALLARFKDEPDRMAQLLN